MTNEITKEEAKKAMEKGTHFGFVPHRLEIKGFSKYNHFPLNVLFMSLAKKDGKQVRGIAVYEPDFHTYKKDGHLNLMRYHNIYGGDCFLYIVYDESNGKYYGEKQINNKKVGSAAGKGDWHKFFAHLTIIGLAKGERCLFKDFAEKPAEKKQ
ncbi:MAG: hypothetical protein A2Y82_04080 [Candidatus Buchananbacteria bacterium RBG_13_36_9]|uniref:Uncharacterized protein n=1 Tax=Candidatus Buchananbacteria bacterium RBG_13_36_9 TaxID=1797530 RepID=A0A1G1XR30_9BACT|nr:MAG: hypothetical protein A2Y82_04080 [Candidatus Buchananbacteria bacterium RBG_13_36_9]